MTATAEKPRSESLLALCRDVIDRATKAGADQAEVFAEHGRQTAVSLEQNDIKGTSTDTHQAIGVRLFVGTQQGFAYANRLDDDGLQEAVTDALAIARTSPGDDANGLVEPAGTAAIEKLADEKLLDLKADDCVELAVEMLQAGLDVDERVRADGALEVTTWSTAVASTTGVATAGNEIVASYGLFGMAVDGDEVGSFDHEYRGVRARGELQPKTVGKLFGEKVLTLLRPVDGRSYKGKVLFHHDAFEEIFLGALISSIDGDNVAKGRSRLKDKLGESVAIEGLTIIDDGTLPGRIGSGHFDREGLPHRRTPLVEGGVLRSFLYDGKAARRAGAKPTGHSSGSARSMPTIGTTNIDVAPGTESDEALFSALGDGLFVQRFAGRVDSVSGDFSGVAKCSYLVEGGKRGPAVKETLIAGNVFTLLNQIVALGATQHGFMSTRCPHVLIDGVDVTAGAS